MIRVLLVVLIACSVSCTLLNEDLKSLEELEDLLNRDARIADYVYQKETVRSPDLLLDQFNNAKRAPPKKKTLEMYLRKLNEKDSYLAATLSPEETKKGIQYIEDLLRQWSPECDESSPGYRTMDGTCNNLAKTEQGAAGTAMKRDMPNAYDDGLSKPRTLSVNGGPLPSTREVSRNVFNDRRRMVADFTQFGMHIGQLTDHDITASHSARVDCSNCSQDGECFSIQIEDSDPVFGGKKQCFTFRRSRHEEDSEGVRQQTNFITSYLDASFVYGSDEVSAAELKEDSGLMKHLTDRVTGRDLLPPDKDLEGCVGVDEAAGIWCGKAGDNRAAEQPGLTALHTLFLREHNRIAGQLRNYDTTLTGDEIYQKTRKILGAEWQHILYNEYLPLIIGEELYTSKELSPNAPYAYSPDEDASILNLFAAAAFRVGHTQVPFDLVRATKNYRRANFIPKIPMKEAFFNATFIFDESIADGAVDSILRGMTVQNLYEVDRRFSDTLVNNLFGDPEEEGNGFDLASLNIQRGRDHGLPSYTSIRKACGLNEITSFQKLIDDDVMTSFDVKGLKKIYEDVKDVDTFVGAVLENHLPYTMVGPTLACIFAEQFHRLKFGDRFFYQNTDQFTEDQIDEIKKATGARLICDNVEAVRKIQPCIFIKASNFKDGKLDLAVARRDGEARRRLFDSFSSRKRAVVLDDLDNSRVFCDSDRIPVVDLSKFV